MNVFVLSIFVAGALGVLAIYLTYFLQSLIQNIKQRDFELAVEANNNINEFKKRMDRHLDRIDRELEKIKATEEIKETEKIKATEDPKEDEKLLIIGTLNSEQAEELKSMIEEMINKTKTIEELEIRTIDKNYKCIVVHDLTDEQIKLLEIFVENQIQSGRQLRVVKSTSPAK